MHRLPSAFSAPRMLTVRARLSRADAAVTESFPASRTCMSPSGTIERTISLDSREPPPEDGDSLVFPDGRGHATFTLVRQRPWRTTSAFHRAGVVGGPTRVLPPIFRRGLDSLTFSPSLRASAPSRVRPRFLLAETCALLFEGNPPAAMKPTDVC